MFIKKQQLLFLKEENSKFTENFSKFWKEHEANKKFISKNHIKDFMEEQKTLMYAINQRIDEIIANGEDDQKRKISENLLQKSSAQKRTRSLKVDETNRVAKRPRKDLVNVNTYLENFLQTPGLQHLAENIYLNLELKILPKTE